jgi:FemAB family
LLVITAPTGAADQSAQSHAGENGRVVALTDDVFASFEGERLKRRTCGHQRASVGILNGFRESAFGVAGGVAQWKNQRSLAMFRHGADGGGREFAGAARRADEHGGAEGFDDLFERGRQWLTKAGSGQIIGLPRDGAFVFFQVGAQGGNDAAGIEKEFSPARFGAGEAVGLQRGQQQVADAAACRVGADEQKALVTERLTGESQAGKNTRESHGSRALKVVVEAGQAAGIKFQQTKGVGFFEIFPLQQGMRENCFDGFNKFFDERIVSRAAQPPDAATKIIRIFKQRGVVRADIQTDGQAMRRVNARAGGIENQFPDGDAHAARWAEVSPERTRLLMSATRSRNDEKFRHLAGPMNRRLQWEEILLYKSRGYAEYDFGGVWPDPANQFHSIGKFKTEFGGEVKNLHNFVVIKNPLLRAAWKTARAVKRTAVYLKSVIQCRG